MEGLRITGYSIGLSSLLILFSSGAIAQERDSIGFLFHLSNLGYYNEALQYLDQIEDQSVISMDSLHYLRGKFHYYQKGLSSSISALNQVSQRSDLYAESQLLAAYQEVYSGNWVAGRQQLQSLNVSDPLLTATRQLLMAGGLLLERDIDGYVREKSLITEHYRQLSQAENQLELVKGQLQAYKQKSPAVAGILSTILPGLGQFYNGNIGQGSMTLLTVGIFGLQTWESYRKDGIKSVRTILFGSLFSGFYIANIWGATLGVKVKKQEFNDQINETILVSMHIPLRYLFD